MIRIKSADEIELMRKACRISAQALRLAGEMCRPGMSTAKIDREIHKFITSNAAYPSFLGYGGFPASACISLNDEVIHGIPSEQRVLREGDIVKVDVGARYKEFNGDCADTFYCGDETKMPENIKNLIETARGSFFAGTAKVTANTRVGDIGFNIQNYSEERGFSVVREYIGHGVGRNLHEAPDVPNFGKAGKGMRLAAGMTIAVEPMLNAGGWEVKKQKDGWTVKTADGKLSAHYENTILITAGGNEILTVC